MVNSIHDRTGGRNKVPYDLGGDSATARNLPGAATRPGTHAIEPGADNEPIAVVCAWCPSLHILRLQRREQDVVVIYWQGKELRIVRNGVNLKISHGICQPCRERLKR